MRTRWTFSLVLSLVVLVTLASGSARAAITDLEVIAIDVHLATGGSCTTQTPEERQPLCVDVEVRNNGPDAYQGASAGSELGISVDIDEPTKPRLPVITGCTSSALFAVNISSGGSVVLTLGPLSGSCNPTSGGTHSVRATATARGSNSDPITGNNSLQASFTVIGIYPAMGFWGILVLSLAIAILGTSLLVRRRS